MSSAILRLPSFFKLLRQMVILAVFGTLATPMAASEKFRVTLSGAVTVVDPALQNTFKSADPFEFGFLLDTANFLSSNNGFTSYNITGFYFKVGSNYSAVGSVPFMHCTFISRARETGGTEQGFSFEMNNMIAPRVNGFPLSDTYISIGFDRPLGTPVYNQNQVIGVQELLSINQRSITLQQSSLSYNLSPYKYVALNIQSMTVVPEPSSIAPIILGVAFLAQARPTRRRINVRPSPFR